MVILALENVTNPPSADNDAFLPVEQVWPRTATIKDLEAGETDRNTNAGEEHNGEVVGEHGGGILFEIGRHPATGLRS